MDLSPHTVASASFKTAKKGFDPDEVRSFLAKVAAQLEASQQQAAAMEARARAAVAKLQEIAHQPAAQAAPTVSPLHPVTVAPQTTPSTDAAPAEPDVAASAAAAAPTLSSGPEESVTIGRTLLLAQRTADLALAEARAEAESITAAARAEAEDQVASAHAAALAMLDAARAEGAHARDDERSKAEEAVQALLARRDFLLGDVEHLEQYVGAQRERLRDAASALRDLADRVPAGLGELRRPLLSASAGDEHLIRPTSNTETPSGGSHASSKPSDTDDVDAGAAEIDATGELLATSPTDEQADASADTGAGDPPESGAADVSGGATGESAPDADPTPTDAVPVIADADGVTDDEIGSAVDRDATEHAPSADDGMDDGLDDAADDGAAVDADAAGAADDGVAIDPDPTTPMDITPPAGQLSLRRIIGESSPAPGGFRIGGAELR